MRRPQYGSISGFEQEGYVMLSLQRISITLAFVSLWLGMSLLQTGMLRAQATQELLIQRKLVASTGGASERFGSALAVSGDVLVATAPYPTFIDGNFQKNSAAYVFVRDQKTGGWAERKRLVPPNSAANDHFGEKVAVDGDTIVVGAPYDRVGGIWAQGSVYVFGRHQGGPDNWGQVAKLTEGLGDISALFGRSVAIKGDLLAVGAPVPGAGGFGSNGRVTIY